METKIHSPADIEVGAYYLDPDLNLLLGVGKRKIFTSDQFHFKCLVIMQGNWKGRVIQEGLWENGFQKIDDQLAQEMLRCETILMVARQ